VEGLHRGVPHGRHFHSSVARSEAKKVGGKLKREVTMVVQSKMDQARDFVQVRPTPHPAWTACSEAIGPGAAHRPYRRTLSRRTVQGGEGAAAP
jgi:hypothetical protein